jgi:hypothetical protein
MRRYLWLIFSVLLLAMVVEAFAQGVSILSPTSYQTVRGVVHVKGQKPDADSGWISYKLSGPGQKDEYIAAVSRPYMFVWNTLKRADGKTLYPDGTYTITATAMNPSGQAMGSSTVSVTVNNSVSGLDAPGSVRLRISYKRGQEYEYDVEGSREAALKKENPMLDAIAKDLDVRLKAQYSDHSMNTSSGGPALIRKRAIQGWYQTGKDAKSISGLGKTYTLVVNPTGAIETKHKGDAHFDLGELTITLPDREVRIGDTWSGDMWVMLDPAGTQRQKVKGQHRLDGFQWMNGMKVARIVSTFSAKGGKFSIHFKNGVAKIESDYKGTRYSYFAYEQGRFIGLEDTIEHDYDIDTSQLSAALSGGMGGMPGMPGAPGMEGMPMPGMPGAPGMDPGMMPGAPGMPPAPGMAPGMPPAPGMAPGMPGAPGMAPGMPGAPGMEGMPGMGGVPGMGGMYQSMPVKVQATGKMFLSVMERAK